MVTLSVAAAAPVTLRSFSAQMWLCVVEARPVVLLVFALRFTTAFALASTVSPHAPSWRVPVALLACLLATGSIYLFDGVMDVETDQLNGSIRPIARGALSRMVGLSVCLGWAALAVGGAFALGSPFTLLVPAALLLGFAYAGPGLRLKRWSPSAGATALAGGLLTFLAGAAASGAVPASPSLLVFALAMSAHVGLVGAVAKDFSDVPGDSRTGRRTWAVMKGTRSASRRLRYHAFAVAGAFLLAAAIVDARLLWPAAAVFGGAIAIAITSQGAAASARPRGPYRAFMTSQYLAHVVLLMALFWP